MEITIKGDPKEIAAFVVALQERRIAVLKAEIGAETPDHAVSARPFSTDHLEM